jgi:GrpB-like predicted nucleotidyltransferase (UPF0157 family)
MTTDIVAYDPSWPTLFLEEAAALRRVLEPWLVGEIEHIGSTAVPGLAAKPVVDILARVRSLEESRPAIAAVSELGYCYAPYRADLEHWFCKPSPSVRTHHLHLVPATTPQWRRTIAFRDYLRSHRDVASEYAELKRQLAAEYPLDREAYTAGKGAFIEHITDLALAAHTYVRDPA